MSKVSNYLRTGENYLHVLFLEAYSRIINAETTVAQKLNQTSYPENGLYIPARRRLGFQVCFFGSFLHYLSRLGGK